MGLDGEVKVPTYQLKDGQLYQHRLGTLEPLTPGNAGKLIENHRHDSVWYARSDPGRASVAAALADELSDLVTQQAAGQRAA